MAKAPVSKQTKQSSGGGGVVVVGALGGILVILAALLFVAPQPKYKMGFESIKEATADANSKEELAAPESYKDHRRPSWKTYHGKTQPGFMGKKINNLMSLIGVKKRPNWSPSYFKYLLEKTTAEREKSGRSADYEFVERIVPTEKSRIIVWGDMSGAYHSMVRCLEKLIDLGIMNEDLTLKSKDDYLAFMGDVASRSPFLMELLTLIMKLQERNPNRVIYMTGNNERRGSWYPYGLREELMAKAPEFSTKEAPYYKVVEKYFETLPLGIYISVPPHADKDFVRLSHFAMETPSKETYREFVELLDDSYYSKELLADRKMGENAVVKLSAKRDAPDLDLVNVRVIMKSYRKMKEYQKNQGLRFIVPDKGASAWTALSSPTVFANKFFDFWSDAFVVIQAAPRIEDWTITLHNRDIRKKDPFKSVEYNFLSGKEAGAEEVAAPEKKIEEKKEMEVPKKVAVLNKKINNKNNRRRR